MMSFLLFLGIKGVAQQTVKMCPTCTATISIPSSFKFDQFSNNLTGYVSSTDLVTRIFLSKNLHEFVIPNISYVLEWNEKIHAQFYESASLLEWDERQFFTGDDRKVRLMATEYLFFPKGYNLPPFKEYNIDLYVEDDWYQLSLQYPMNVYQDVIGPKVSRILESFLVTGKITGEKVKMVFENGVFKIPVQLNNSVSGKFIFDTGASTLLVSQDVFLKLKASGTISENDFIRTAEYVDANGDVSNFRQYMLRTVKVGERTVSNVICAVSKENGEDMLLGQSFLKRLGTFELDYYNNYLIFK